MNFMTLTAPDDFYAVSLTSLTRRPLGVLPRRSAGSDGGTARRASLQDLQLAAVLGARLLHPQGVQEAAEAEVGRRE